MSLFESFQRGASHFGVPLGIHGNVAVLPGILETDLKDQAGRHLWIFPPAFEKLKLEPNGVDEDDPTRSVTTDGANFVCEALIGVLRLSWNVLVVGYDWRKDLGATAMAAANMMTRHFGDQPFHIVAHSMGGLVGRLIRANVPGIQRGGRFVMIGTPNHGSHLAVRALTVDNDAAALLRLFGIAAQPGAAMAAARTWPGAYQLLPCPRKDPEINSFYRNPPANLSRDHLRSAEHLHARLDELRIDHDVIQILGTHIPTYDGDQLPTSEGDGVVSHRLGRLDGARTVFVFGDHVALPSHPLILASITTLLQTGNAAALAGDGQIT